MPSIWKMTEIISNFLWWKQSSSLISSGLCRYLKRAWSVAQLTLKSWWTNSARRDSAIPRKLHQTSPPSKPLADPESTSLLIFIRFFFDIFFYSLSTIDFWDHSHPWRNGKTHLMQNSQNTLSKPPSFSSDKKKKKKNNRLTNAHIRIHIHEFSPWL